MAAFKNDIHMYFTNYRAGFDIGFEEIRILGKANWPALSSIAWSLCLII